MTHNGKDWKLARHHHLHWTELLEIGGCSKLLNIFFCCLALNMTKLSRKENCRQRSGLQSWVLSRKSTSSVPLEMLHVSYLQRGGWCNISISVGGVFQRICRAKLKSSGANVRRRGFSCFHRPGWDFHNNIRLSTGVRFNTARAHSVELSSVEARLHRKCRPYGIERWSSSVAIAGAKIESCPVLTWLN